jgi:hypothetical protein
MFTEVPAKWTGNGSKMTKPDKNDWYETVKVNYGIRPDGSKDFPELPAGYVKQNVAEHLEFWKGKNIDSWIKIQGHRVVLDRERGGWISL